MICYKFVNLNVPQRICVSYIRSETVNVHPTVWKGQMCLDLSIPKECPLIGALILNFIVLVSWLLDSFDVGDGRAAPELRFAVCLSIFIPRPSGMMLAETAAKIYILASKD